MAETPGYMRSLARTHTQAAINVLKSIMLSPKAPAAARVAAARALLDRGWATAHQPIEAEKKPEYVVEIPAPVRDMDEWMRLYGPKRQNEDPAKG